MFVCSTNTQGPRSIPQFLVVLNEALHFSLTSLYQSIDLYVMLQFQILIFILMNEKMSKICCSFKCAIEKSTKTMTEAQEKNHTDPVDLSSRTPLGQLMRRAVTYTHQAGAGGTNAPFSSRKKFSLFLSSPRIMETSYPTYF